MQSPGIGTGPPPGPDLSGGVRFRFRKSAAFPSWRYDLPMQTAIISYAAVPRRRHPRRRHHGDGVQPMQPMQPMQLMHSDCHDLACITAAASRRAVKS